MKRFVLALVLLTLVIIVAQLTGAQEGLPPTLKRQEGPSSSPQPSPAKTNNGEQQVSEGDVIRVETNLVTVPVSVMDSNDRYVATLRKEDFHIYEDGVEQKITYFAPLEQPVTVAFVVDVSASVRQRLADIGDAANTFFNNLRDKDRILVVSFDSRVHVLVETIEVGEIRKDHKQIHLRPGDSTHLYEAVDFVLNKRLKRISGRKAMVLFTDGCDDRSPVSFKRNLYDAEELDVLIYPVQYNSLRTTLQLMELSPQYRRSIHLSKDQIIKAHDLPDSYLHGLAQKSGGRYYDADTLAEIRQTFESVAEELRHQYSLGYYPNNHAQTGERQIKVKVYPPVGMVRARASYIVDKDRLQGK
jgi:Ca-activated chloride channel family protein